MKSWTRLALGLVAVAGLTVPSMAVAGGPAGLWELENGESRISVSYCGDGSALCAKLDWVRPDALEASEYYTDYLGRPVSAALTPMSPTQWRGQMVLDGREVEGTVRMVGNDQMRVTGCLGMLCDTVVMNRL